MSPSRDRRVRSRSPSRDRSCSRRPSRDTWGRRSDKSGRRRAEMEHRSLSVEENPEEVTVPIKVNDRKSSVNTKIEARLCADNYRLLHELQENYPRIKVNFDTANLELTFIGHPYDVGNAMLQLFSWLKKRYGIWYSEYQNVFHVARSICERSDVPSRFREDDRNEENEIIAMNMKHSEAMALFDTDKERRSENIGRVVVERGDSEENEIGSLEEKYDKLQNRFKIQSEEIKKLNKSILEMKEKVQQEQSEKVNLKADYELKKNKLKTDLEREKTKLLKDIDQKKAKMDSEMENLKKNLELQKAKELEEEKDKLKAEYENYKAQFIAKNDEYQTRIISVNDNHRDQNQNLKQENSNSHDTESRAMMSPGSVKVETGHQEDNISFLKKRLAAERNDLNKLWKRYKGKRELVEMRDKEIAGHKNVIDARDKEVKTLKEEVNDLKKQLTSDDDGIEVLN